MSAALRPRGIYGSATPTIENHRRFGLRCAAALDLAQHELADRVDVAHAHDWQAGLAPLWLRTAPQRWTRLARAGLAFTIDNLAYQGAFPRSIVPALGLDWQVFTMTGAEFWGRFSFLKAGLTSSGMVTTVSPTYARETRTPEAGSGPDCVLQALAIAT